MTKIYTDDYRFISSVKGCDGINIIYKLKKRFSKGTRELNRTRERNGNELKVIPDTSGEKSEPAVHDTGPSYKNNRIAGFNKEELIQSLTPRERTACEYLLEGLTINETAKRMEIGYPTANTYQTAIYKKLHVNSRAELIINYRGIVHTPEVYDMK